MLHTLHSATHAVCGGDQCLRMNTIYKCKAIYSFVATYRY